jgi:serine protease Do
MLRVAFGILILTMASAAPAPAVAQQVRVSARAGEPDSLGVLRVELQKLTNAQRTLMRDYQLAHIALSRANTDAARATWRARVAELAARVERAITDAEVIRAQLQSLCASRPGPQGWIGINISEAADVAASPSGTAFTFKNYPSIVAVEPGSPAQKAGLAAGDEILTLGTLDMLSGALDVALLLKPGVELPVRYRRDGIQRKTTVLVEPRPEGFNSGCPLIEVTVEQPALATNPKLRIIRTPNGFGYAFADSAAARPRGPVLAPVEASTPKRRETPMPVLPPTPYTAFRLHGALPGPNAMVAGAVLVPLNDDLRNGLGVQEGILVFDVARSSPALEAGLRAGDIIIRVNGRKLTSIPMLMTVLDDARDGEVELQVSRRNAKARIVRLRP